MDKKAAVSKKGIICFAVWEIIILAISVQLAVWYGKYHSYQKFILITGLLLMAASAFAYYALYIRKTSKEITYIGLACILGLVFNLLIPVYCAPDEQVHYWKAYQLSNKMMFIDSDVKAITMRADDYALPVRTDYNKGASEINEYYQRMNDALGDTSLKPTEHYSTDIPEYLYVVPAAGLTLGRLLGLNPILAFMLGRIFSNLLFIAGTAWAINRTPAGKLIIMFTAFLPMTLQQAASLSYDAPVIVCSFILIAYTLRLIGGGEMERRDWIIYALAAMFMMPVKSFAYILLAFMPLIAAAGKKADKQTKRAAAYVVLAAICFCILVYLWDKVLFHVDRTPGADPGNIEHYTLAYLMTHPGRIWILIETTFRGYFGFYVSSMIGEYLGWINIQAPPVFTFAVIVLLMLASLKRKKEPMVLDKKMRIGLALTAALTCCFIFGGMLLSWTPLESNLIEGVQGRYFLPVLPIALVCTKTKELEIDARWDSAILFSYIIWLSICVLCIINRYQL